LTIISNGSNDPQRAHETNGSARTSRPSRPQGGTPDRAAAGSAPSVEVSAQGGRFLSLRARLEALDASRAERVERLRQEVAAGRYQPDSEATAAAMLTDPATAAALGMR
jgi:flagellar biosynthesis anti-sigma factor FlgM